MMSYFLGVDLGTTRTSAAVGHPGRPVEVVDLGDRSSAVPSVLHIGGDGTVLVGDAAERRAITDPSRVLRDFVRRTGDPAPLVVAGAAWSPQELSARVVRYVVDRVRDREGGPAGRIAVTHPASWGPHQRDLLGSALAGQGLPVSFLPGPTAAAVHRASAERLAPGSTIAVYDLGGGTFDAAVVHRDGARGPGPTAAGFTLVGRPEGIERLGGVDFDQAVFDHVRAALPDAFAALDDTDPAVLAAIAAVRRECSEAKEVLSADTEVTIPVLLPGAQGSVRLHRTEFEAMIRPRIEDTVAALRRAVASAGLGPEQLTAVLLVGGSSRIPLVAQLVSEQLGRPVAVDADPENAIALGAARSLDPVAAASGAHVPVQRSSGGPGRPVATGSSTRSSAGATVVGPAPGRPGSGTGARRAAPRTAALSAPLAAAAGALPPGSVPPPRPPQGHERPRVSRARADRYEDDDLDDPRRGTPAMLISAGGLAAALAVVAGMFLLPTTGPVRAAETSTVPSLPSVGAPVTTEEPPPSTTEAAPVTTEDDEPERPRRTRRPVAPPLTTAPLLTTTPALPPPTTEPTTTEPTPTTEPEQPPPGGEGPPAPAGGV